MKKTILLILLSVIIVLILYLIFADKETVSKVGNEEKTTEERTALPTDPMVGNDADEHGCRLSAGYSWCAIKQKCFRPWEEKCE